MEFLYNERHHDELYCALLRTQERIERDWMEAVGSPQRTVDELEFSEMVRKGSKAWADVPDAADWVEALRGGEE